MSFRRLIVILAALGVVAAACGGTNSEADEIPDTTEAVVSDVDVSTTGDSSAAAAPQPAQSGDLVVQDGDLVEVDYVGTLDDGTQFDSSREPDRSPLSFTVGTGQVIAGFDAAVLGAKVGDVRTERMEAVDAYGEWNEDRIIEVPFNPDQGDVQVGEEVFLTNGQPAIVLEVTDETVKLDANHPLAGEALTFEVEILSITRG